MADKLNAGDAFPSLTLKLAGGKTLNVPSGLTVAGSRGTARATASITFCCKFIISSSWR